MKVRFWGTRGSIATPGKETVIYGGNTTCVEIILSDGQRVVIDAGTGIRALGQKMKAGGEDVDFYLFITHIHWDHVLGFPFFSPIHEEKTTIRIDGFPNCMKGIRYPFENRMGDGFFPVSFDDLKAHIIYLDKLRKGPLHIGDTIVDTVLLHHPQGGYGYRFREGDRILVFITDNELVKGEAEAFDPYVRFCEGADLLIHDAQYGPEEIKRRRGWGHSNYEDVVSLAMKAGVSKLVLFHHDPSRTDLELQRIERHCVEIAGNHNSDLVVEAAREGSELTL